MRLIACLPLLVLLLLGCDTSDPLEASLPVPAESRSSPLEPPPRSIPPGILAWYGDVVGLRHSSRVFPRLSVDGRIAFLRLGNALCFTMGGVGAAGTITPQAEAFHALLAEPLRVEAFLELVASPLPAAQMYGLAGLHLAAPHAFHLLAPSFTFRTDAIPTFFGCSFSEHHFVELLGTDDSPPSLPVDPVTRQPSPRATVPNPGVQRTRFARR